MVRKKPLVPPSEPPSISPEDAILLLRERIQKAEELFNHRPLQQSDIDAWSYTTKPVLQKSFGAGSPNVDAVLHAQSSISAYIDMPDHEFEEYLASKLENQIKMLHSCIEQLEIEMRISQVAEPPRPIVQQAIVSRRVFIAHGHDQGSKDTVARLLTKLKFEPVILHEQPNQGRTLIEKFEDYADVGFAVVILTADDLGRAAKEAVEQPRARQNVILELGFFVGKLGRQSVCALHERGVELPSDLAGIVYISLEGDWKIPLVRELRAAGYTVDANLIV